MSGLSHKNVPVWLERNILFRKLFLLRKRYLTRLKFTHYSGAAEDVSIRKIFSGHPAGVFVDVGCYHPIKYSNTWALYKRGWRGVNIDIDELKIELFNMTRPRDVNIACAVSNHSGTVKFYRAGLFSQINTIVAEESRLMKSFVTLDVPSRTLTEILDSSKYKDKKIDLLCVDAEGHDYEVISSLDFARYQPLVVAMESHNPTFNQVEQTEIYRYMRALGYTLVGWCGETLLMASAEYAQKLEASRA